MLGDRDRAVLLLDLFRPYSGLLVVFAGGSHCTGAVDRYLGMLATVLGRFSEAEAWLDAAIGLEERAGSPPSWPAPAIGTRRMLATSDRPADPSRASDLLAASLRTPRRLAWPASPPKSARWPQSTDRSPLPRPVPAKAAAQAGASSTARPPRRLARVRSAPSTSGRTVERYSDAAFRNLRPGSPVGPAWRRDAIFRRVDLRGIPSARTEPIISSWPRLGSRVPPFTGFTTEPVIRDGPSWPWTAHTPPSRGPLMVRSKGPRSSFQPRDPGRCSPGRGSSSGTWTP